jgi:membrane protease subunit HflC
LREEFGKRTVHDVVSGERDKIMEQMREKADIDARKIGVQIVDVRLKRVELPNEVSDAVYRRMEAERKRVANELRSKVLPKLRKFVPMPIVSAKSSLPKPIAMPRRSRVKVTPRQPVFTPRLFGQNPEFYAFYRSLEAYRGSFKNKSDILVVEPNSEFFKYMKSRADTTKANDLDAADGLRTDAGARRPDALYSAGGLA